jgi:hypothetical protein
MNIRIRIIRTIGRLRQRPQKIANWMYSVLRRRKGEKDQQRRTEEARWFERVERGRSK